MFKLTSHEAIEYILYHYQQYPYVGQCDLIYTWEYCIINAVLTCLSIHEFE